MPEDMPGSTAAHGSGGATASTYRLGLAHLLRACAPLCLVLGVTWLVVALLDAAAPVRVVLTVITVGVLALCALFLLRPPAVLRLTTEGYAISLVRGAGVKAAPWSEVASVATQPVGGATSLVITLRNGRTSIMPLSLLGAQQATAQGDVRVRLNSAHGYRRLTQP
ncbi:MAG: hypothetical protein H0V49_00065 [Nocardioidaceae bacterium]|nr:hypothetical protein [Nocardioidaceae bacterium]